MSNVCLVTGGAGFLGCALSGPLTEHFDRVVALDVLHPQVHAQRVRPPALAPTAELVVGDVSDPSVWDRLLENVKPQVIVHLAAETGTGQSLLEASRHARTNVVGTTEMTDALARHHVIPQRIVLASSRAVYGEGRWVKATGEFFYPGMRTHAMLAAGQWDFPGTSPTAQFAPEVIPSPANVYAATKLAQENLLSSWCGSQGVEFVKYRLQNVYGVGQSLTNPYTGIVSMFARWAAAGQTIPVYEDGHIIRDFVYIDDTVNAMMAGILRGKTNRHAYDVGTGEPTTILTLAHTIANHYGAPAPHVTGQFREGDVRGAWANTYLTTSELGWQPTVELREGIERLCAWIDETEPALRASDQAEAQSNAQESTLGGAR